MTDRWSGLRRIANHQGTATLASPVDAQEALDILDAVPELVEDLRNAWQNGYRGPRTEALLAQFEQPPPPPPKWETVLRQAQDSSGYVTIEKAIVAVRAALAEPQT